MQKTFEKIEGNLKEVDDVIRTLSCNVNKYLPVEFNPFEVFCESNKGDTNTLEGIFNELWIRYHYTWAMQEEIESEINGVANELKLEALSKLLKEIESVFPKIFEVVNQLRKDNVVYNRFSDYLKMFLYAKECSKVPIRKYKEVVEASDNQRNELYNAEYDFELGTFCKNFKFSCNLMEYLSKSDLQCIVLKKYKKFIIAYQEHEGNLIYILARIEDGKFAFETVNIAEKDREIRDFENVSEIIDYTRMHNMNVLNAAVCQLQ